MQQSIAIWMRWLRLDVGFDAWRFDFVKGAMGWATAMQTPKVCETCRPTLEGVIVFGVVPFICDPQPCQQSYPTVLLAARLGLSNCPTARLWRGVCGPLLQEEPPQLGCGRVVAGHEAGGT